MCNKEKMRELISAYVDSEATQQERLEVESHLKECAQCAQYYKELKGLRVVMGRLGSEELSGDSIQKIRKDFLGGKKTGEAIMKKKILVSAGSVALMMLLVFTFAVKTNIVQHNKVMVPIDVKTVNVKMDIPVTPQTKNKTETKAAPVVTAPAIDATAIRAKGEAMLKEAGVQASATTNQGISQPKGGSLASAFINRSVQGGLKDSSYMISGGDSYSKVSAAMSVESYSASAVGSADSFDYAVALSGDDVYLQQASLDREGYSYINETDFLEAKENPLSTFSIDVDTASYSNLRRFLIDMKRLPPKDAIRIEEMVNYFTYDYPQPKGEDPFSVTIEVNDCPWNKGHKLALVGLQGKIEKMDNLPPSNLVFLLDVSGSMGDRNKLALIQQVFPLLVKNLRAQDTVSVVTYAGDSAVVLDSVSGDHKETINNAIAALRSGGCTAGANGIKAAYGLAMKNFAANGNNRVILATDGDFNVGVTSDGELTRMIEEYRENGVYLTVLGFGAGNYQDAKMEQLADKGNGNFAYIDNLSEGKKVFANQLTGTLYTIAKDVKLQIEFNPGKVKAYRLVGYENRMLKKEDFNNDKKDAGELGAGHTVTALYELVMADSKEEFGKVDALKYVATKLSGSDEVMTVKLRYKPPKENVSKLITQTVEKISGNESENFRFASAVAECGMLLRDSKFRANASYGEVIARAKAAKGRDDEGYRAEFIRMVETAEMLSAQNSATPSNGSNNPPEIVYGLD